MKDKRSECLERGCWSCYGIFGWPLSTLEFLALQEEKTLQQSCLLIRLQDLLSLHVALCLRRLIMFPQAREEDRRGKHHIKFHRSYHYTRIRQDQRQHRQPHHLNAYHQSKNQCPLPYHHHLPHAYFESECEPATFGERVRFGFRSWFIPPTRPVATMTAMPPT